MTADFWSRLVFGIRVVVAGKGPDRLFGVRDGFRRYLGDGMGLATEVRVEARGVDDARDPLPLEDGEILRLARDRASELPEADFEFRVGTEAGLLSLCVGGEERWLVRTWTVIRGLGEESWGSSGSLQLPTSVIEGLDASALPHHVPGTRRHGGMVASLTGGLERRRDAISLSTVHALSTLFYPFLETGKGRGARREPSRLR